MPGMPHHRLTERAELKARFINGISVLMLAPRRIGKTWLMDAVKADMEAFGWLCVRLDVEGVQNEEAFLRELCQEIEKSQDLKTKALAHITQRFRQLLGRVEGGNLAQAIGMIDHRQFLETLVEALNKEQKKTLILIDEIALFILELTKTDPDSARSLLYHLRKLRQVYRNVMWFLTGSVGLDVVGRRHDMYGAMLGIDIVSLEPFTAEAAHSYVEELFDKKLISQPFEFGDGAFEYLVKELGWLSPYHLEQVVKLVGPRLPATTLGNRPIATIADVERAFDKILQPSNRLHFAAWDEHIDKNFPEDASHMRSILEVACENADGEIEATYLARLSKSDPAFASRQLKNLLTNLANDAYLVKAGQRWKFQSGLLRRYWREYAAG
jgi:hypothetical protein